MTRFAALLFLAVLGTAILHADTIYQTNAQGRQAIVQRDAILVKQDSSLLVYKHFDLRERRVVRVTLNQGSLPYTLVASDAAEREHIVATWKRFGYKATVTDTGGKTTAVFDAYVDFYPPGGRGSLLESVPPRTSIPILFDSGAADEIEFSKIERLDVAGDHLTLTLRTGKVASGKLLVPTNQPAEGRLMGITDHYDPASEEVFDFSQPLAKIKQITFE